MVRVSVHGVWGDRAQPGVSVCGVSVCNVGECGQRGLIMLGAQGEYAGCRMSVHGMGKWVSKWVSQSRGME